MRDRVEILSLEAFRHRFSVVFEEEQGFKVGKAEKSGLSSHFFSISQIVPPLLPMGEPLAKSACLCCVWSESDECVTVDLLHIQKKVAADMSDHYGEAKTLPDGMVKDNLSLLEAMLLEKTRVDEHIRRNFTDPLNKYKQQYRELEERMRERQRRYEEMVKYEDDVRKYKKNNDARLAGTEKRLASAKQGYEDLHAELLEDIPKLCDDKVAFFEPMVAVLIDAQVMFYARMAEKLQDVQSKITHVDRSAASTHPKVIRPRQESAVGRSYSAFGGGSSAPRPESNQYAPQQQGGYGAQQGGYAPQQGGYPPQQGGYAPQQQGGYAPQQGGYQAPPQGGGAAPPPVPHRSLPPAPGGPAQPRARGQWDFNTVQPNELPFRAGDVLNIVDQSGGDWWTAELNGRTGLVPANYVQLI